MKRTRVAEVLGVFLLIFAFALGMLPRQIVAEPFYATTATIIANNILTDTVWTPAGNPYILSGNITVSSGVTLTVEPGTLVQGETLSGLIVNGRLMAVGTVTQPISFTGASASAGAWGGIEINGTSSAWNSGSRLEYVTVAYGGQSPAKGNLSLRYASATIRHSRFDNALGDGIYGSTSGGYADISDTGFNGNSGYAVNISKSDILPVLSNLSASGNGTDGVALGYGTLTGDGRWYDMGLPYILRGDITVSSGATLTVEPGMPVQGETLSGLIVNGRLMAVGTVTQPISFTGVSASAGAWGGIEINGTSSAWNSGSRLEYVTVAYGGQSPSDGNLSLRYASATVRHSRFDNALGDGIYGSTSGGYADISDTGFNGNSGYAVNISKSDILPVLSNLSASGNGTDGVALGYGTLTGDGRWYDMGLPYILRGDITVSSGATLTVEPGTPVRATSTSQIISKGRLMAAGTASQPITFTAVDTATGWQGISIEGTSAAPNLGSQLRYVTIEYGGHSPNYGNLVLDYAKAVIDHATINNSLSSGLQARTDSLGTIAASRIFSNTTFGAETVNNGHLLAANNWWGSPFGPTVSDGCNPGGTGDTISGNVAYSPFLTAADQDPGVLTPSDVRVLSLSPQKWFIPGDGVTRAWVTITLRDGAGNPMAGRMVRLHSTLGTVTDGGITDVRGQALAYVLSNTPGDAELTATLDASACEYTRSAGARITFTPFDAGLFPDSPAPYLANGISISPRPIVKGVTTTVQVKITNPGTATIRVNGTFGIVQSSVGLPFGPLGDVQNLEIPPSGQKTVTLNWVPQVSGHYCIEFNYNWTTVGTTPRIAQEIHTQFNLNVHDETVGSSEKDDALSRAETATGIISKAGGGYKGATRVPMWMVNWHLNWLYTTGRKISNALGGDPPRQDYREIAMPEKPTIPPITTSDGVSQARADALNNLADTMADVVAFGNAATITLDRIGGAAAADDLQWTSQQTAVLNYYKQQMGTSLITASVRLDAFLTVLDNEGEPDVYLTADDLRAIQDELRTTGYPAEAITAAHDLGMTDSEIEAFRQQELTGDPVAEAGSLRTYFHELSAAYRNLGQILLAGQNFPTVGTGRMVAHATATPNRLARVFDTETTLQVGNPYSTTETVNLVVRPLELPDDWGVVVSPASVLLSPGEVITATVRYSPGAASVQGNAVRVAIEGYISGTLIGGVVQKMLVPEAQIFNGSLRVYLPLVLK